MRDLSKAPSGPRRWISRIHRVGSSAAFAVGLLLAAASSNAQEAPRVPVDQATTQQKSVLLKRLVTSSVSAKRIEESGDAKAMAKLETARKLVLDADALLKTGDFRAANGKLDAALALINQETRRVSEQEVSEASLRKTYDRRLHAVQTFQAALERVSKEKQSGSAAAAQVEEIKRLVTEAEASAGEGKLEQGIARLDQAYRAARGDIRDLRKGETLTRSLDFDTPEAEYDYERNRNDSHIMLLKFALSEKQPSTTRLTAIEKLRETAAQQRVEGEQRAEAGDYPKAIDALLRSTEGLLKAIRMSGIYVPG